MQPAVVIPDRIGRYRIVRILGQGGMGVVYHAHDEQLDRPVAIKVVATAHANAIGRQRLQREAKAAASIRHPHICQIYDIGDENGDPFIAMELLEGEPLSERLARGALPVPEAIGLALQVLDALKTLHERGIVHRDLKPSNVFMTAHGAKLLDFGLARQTAAVSGDTMTASPLTQVGAAVGTPHYMSPEQFRGEAVDARSDVFSAGVMLFEMLTGKKPFSGRSDLDVYHAIMYEQPATLGGSPAVAIVDGVIRRALAKHREERIQSAADMTAALRGALAAQDSGAPIQTRIITRVMVLPFRMLRPDPDIDFLALSLPDAITLSLAGLESLVVRSTAAAARYAADAPDLKRIADEAEVDVLLVGTILSAGQQIRVSSQLLTAPQGTLLWSDTSQVTLTDVFQLQDQIVTRIVESLSHQLTASEHRTRQRDVPASPRAYELYLRGNQIIVQGLRGGQDLSIARDLYLRCVEEDPGYAPAWARLGRCYWLLGRGMEEGARLLAQADTCFQKALALNPDLALAHNLYAQVELDLNRATEATIRLLGRIREGRAEPELYAALTQTCRYCGFLEASAAAHERARNLDPEIQTSVNHTFYQLGNLARSQKEMGRGTIYLDVLILFEQGKTDDALHLVRERERTNLLPVTRAHLGGLRAFIEGNRDESNALWKRIENTFTDPEGMVYQARALSVFGETRDAVLLLEKALDRGFNPLRMLKRPDAWLDSARLHADYPRLVERARQKYAVARQAFVDAGGERLLGVSVPVL
jgi:eukaryotic-like serine/threonine-protein kinase